jgi:hypothetical protein
MFDRSLIWGCFPIRIAGMATALDAGKGRPREAVEAVKDDGAGALHLAARHGRTPVCAYLVEELRVDVNAMDDSGCSSLPPFC